jgi:sugar phosphate isomerase/epimerase
MRKTQPARTRRQFLGSLSMTLVGSSLALSSRTAFASPLGLSLGLQLYSVRDMLAKDYLGTLKQVSSLGYREVEAAGFFGHTPEQVKRAMSTAGLSLVSAHYSSHDLLSSFDENLAFAKALGLKYMICSFPGIKQSARLKDQSYATQVQSFTLEDYRWNAGNFNAWGRKVKAAGMQFGYHNHTMEFAPQDGVIPFDELVRLTDPELVTFEMDCGWVIVGGGDPVAYLERYPTRISMLHVKDFKAASKPATVIVPPAAAELGHGTLDYLKVFKAARKGSLRHYFVEQEAYDMPPYEALRIDAQYMQKLNV